MPKPTIECSNCNQRFEAHYPYCPYCGQQAEDKLTLGVLFSNTISNYFSVDARFFRSFVPLMLSPGYLAKKFVQGQRLLYLHPAQMYLFISVVFFFLFSFISRDQVQIIDSELKEQFDKDHIVVDSLKQKREDSIQKREDSIIKEAVLKPIKANQKQWGMSDAQVRKADSSMNSTNNINTRFYGMNIKQAEIDSMIDSAASDKEILTFMGMKQEDGVLKKRFFKQILKFYRNKNGGSILQAFYDSIPIAMFILLPIFAFILKIFYLNKGPFAYHLVFSFYFFSFLFTVFSFLVASSLIWEDFSWWIILVVMLSTFFYLVFGVKRFYGQGFFLSFIKCNVISFVFLSIVIPFAATIMGVMAFLFY